MYSRFWYAAAAVHLVLLSVSFLLARWCLQRTAAPLGAWLARLSAAAGLFGLTAFAVSVVGSLAATGSGGFTLMRLLAQALFGEAIVLASVLAVAHARRGRRMRAAVLAAPALVLLAIYAEAYHLEPQRLGLERHALDLTRGTGHARTFRIVHFTDIQSARVGPYEERALRLGLEQQPDLVVFTGDYLHERFPGTADANAVAFHDLLVRVGLDQVPLGAYAVPGDCERGGWARLFSGTGVRALQNTSARITLPGGVTLSLVGLDLPASRLRARGVARQVVRQAPPADLVVVMGHAPDFVMALSGQEKVDLALAGHTHGGQVALPFFGPPITLTRLPRRYAGGLNDYRGLPLHVSRGVGMERGTAPQIRFLVPPEVCVLDVKY
jgi:uncharacterized protein